MGRKMNDLSRWRSTRSLTFFICLWEELLCGEEHLFLIQDQFPEGCEFSLCWYKISTVHLIWDDLYPFMTMDFWKLCLIDVTWTEPLQLKHVMVLTWLWVQQGQST